MSRKGFVVALVAATALLIQNSATARWGQDDGPPRLERTPAEGPPGTVIEVSGERCTFPGPRPGDEALVRAFLVVGQPGVPFDFFARFPVDDDGTWSGQLPVPTDAPPGQYSMEVACFEGDAVIGGAQEVPFTVLGLPVAPPADPLPEAPDFTG